MTPLDEMLTAEKEALTEQRERDDAYLGEFLDFLKEKNVEVETLLTDISAEFVFIKLLDKLKTHIQYRRDLIEKEQAQRLTAKEVPAYERSYTYKHSKFGVNSPITPYCPRKTKDHAVLYRERLYFLSDEAEREKFLLEPSKYTKGAEAFPTDLLYKPRCVVLGLPKSGKSDLCQALSQRTGAVHLQIEDIIEMFIERDSNESDKLRQRAKQYGKELDDL